MKKLKRPKRPRLRHLVRRQQAALKDALPSSAPAIEENIPRITNETVAAHREEVIGKARKYKYPLQHSKHRIVLVSTSLFVAGAVAFFTYCVLALYRFQSTSSFVYRVTQVIPFPIARVDNRFVSYESYLFELRHYIHYYESQTKLDFKSKEGKQQLAAYKKTALDSVINDAYIKELAEKNHVTLSDKELNDQITVVRQENRLGNSDKVFEDVLKDYWGWTIDDFKRSVREELLSQKVVSSLDAATHKKADIALVALQNGGDFAAVAKQYSEDPGTKDNGGDVGLIGRADRDLPPQTAAALFALKPGQISGVINTGFSLEIVKNIETNGDKIHAAHIVFKLQDISTFLKPLHDKQKATEYITPTN